MIWLVLSAIALAVFVVMLALMRRNRGGWEALAAAILLGLAGYALQGHSGIPSAPKLPPAKATGSGEDMLIERQAFAGSTPQQNKWVLIGDAFARQGEYAQAATVLRGAVAADPQNSDAWLAMANALMGHAQGNLSPAALYAFRHARAADPASPGPPYFLGLAMARAGRFDETEALWSKLLASAPEKAPWRADLAFKLEKLDKLRAMIRQEQAGMPAGPQSEQAQGAPGMGR